jgi:nucleotide-binding universal stress UspA family protein
MFTRILVPLDGSTRAEQALPVAARIARASVEARLLLVRAVTVPASYGLAYEEHAPTWRAYHDDIVEAGAYLQDVAQSVTLGQTPIDTLVGVGPAAQVIIETAIERRADLVVLTSHGRSGLGRWVLGSVAGDVTHHAPMPVFILRAHTDTTRSADMSADVDRRGLDNPHMDHPLRVFVPLDGSPLAETALEPARALASALAWPGAADIRLALVIAPDRMDRENMPEALLLDGATAYLERTAQRLRRRAQAAADAAADTDAALCEVTWSVIAHWDYAQGIIAAAEIGETGRTEEGNGGNGHIQPSDVIVMATHGRSAFARWTLGSVTERTLHATHLPLLIVRPAEMAPVETIRPADAAMTEEARGG